MNNETNPCFIHNNFGTFIVYITVLISSISVSESLLVVCVIWFTERLQRNTDILVASLAINDLILGFAFTSNQILTVPLGVVYPIDTKLLSCIVSGLSSGTTNLSMMHMGMIAIDRYIQIAYPFYYMKAMTKTRTYSILLVLWIVNFIFFIIPPTVYNNDQYHKRCILLHQPIVYYSAGFTTYVTSLVLVFVCYLKIAHVAFRHKKASESRRRDVTITQAEIHLRNNVRTALR
ncbi:unnamed protein product, partial [Candidula unifasciata]